MSSFNRFHPIPDQSIIAMKGHPYTRKSEFAKIIAKFLGCPLVSLEDILDSLTPPLSPEKEFEAFKVICNIAFHHLNSEISKKVVIDSPLSSQSHLIHLVRHLSSIARVIVIECKPTHTYSWKLKFEEHLACPFRSYHVKWYMPKKWEDVEKAIQQHPDYDVTSLSPNVSKLVVDPLLDCPNSYCGYSGNQTRLVEAVKYIMTRDEGDGPNVFVYRHWLHQFKHLSSSSSPLSEEHCSRHGHDIVPNSTAMEGIQHDTLDCMACKRQVMRSNNTGHTYCYCRNCSLTLHMKCALSCKDYEMEIGETMDGRWALGARNFRKPCREGGIGCPIKCKTCKFNDHLESGLYPTAIKHFDAKEHFLTILFFDDEEFHRCAACGQTNGRDMYLCKDSGITYHYECVTMPRRVKNVHGGHHHHLSLKLESEEAEDYLCQECQELRDPMMWYYSCEDCSGYELHPYCVAKLRAWRENYPFGVDREWMDKEEIEAAEKFDYEGIKMKESESISEFYSRVIHMIQWYGHLREEADLVDKTLGSLPLKFYHIVVAIKRSKEYKSMTVDQLMISLRLYEKRIDNGEDVLIEQVLANLYATQWSGYNYYKVNWGDKWIMNVDVVSLETVQRCDYTKGESGENWTKYWGKYKDNYWFYHQRGYYSREDKSKVQCSICKMFGHDPGDCWSVLDTVIVGPRIVQSQSN